MTHLNRAVATSKLVATRRGTHARSRRPGSKRAIGRAAQWDLTLDLSALSGVTLYEPAELVLSAQGRDADRRDRGAGRGATIRNSRSSRWTTAGARSARQGAARIGGVIAANLSGPRRIKAGAARDHFLGFTAVSGRGETFKSGGRVVKNVTGYDLSKLMAGSWGTLAVMTDVTVKVLPRAETEATVAGAAASMTRRAMRMLNAAMGSAGEVSGAAHVPAAVAGAVADRGRVAAVASRRCGSKACRRRSRIGAASSRHCWRLGECWSLAERSRARSGAASAT